MIQLLIRIWTGVVALLNGQKQIRRQLYDIQCDLRVIKRELAEQRLLIEEILALVKPLPAVGFVFTVDIEGEITEGAKHINMTNSQQLTATIQPVDAKGQPALVDGVPDWASSDETIITVAASDDGMSAVVAAVGPLGDAKVSVTADADLGAGVSAIFGTLDVSITQGQAVGFKITTSDPVEQGATPTPTPTTRRR